MKLRPIDDTRFSRYRRHVIPRAKMESGSGLAGETMNDKNIDPENPFNPSPRMVPVGTFDIVVFGATGDLAMRKLFPALFHRWRDNQIPDESRIIGASRSSLEGRLFSDIVLEQFRAFHPKETIDPAEWDRFAKLLDYVEIDALDASAPWQNLADRLADDHRERIFYLALPPGLYGKVSANLASAGLVSDKAKLVLEKPIGKDRASAQAINEAVGEAFDENRIFRIDHYLGKETVQNLLVLRFMNSLFEPVWNANNIDHIQITVAETLGAGSRAGYYDTAGALRDMVQNHMLQLVCLTTMEPPNDLDSDNIRTEKIKVLRALRPITQDAVRKVSVRGQYRSGAIDGQSVSGYADEVGFSTDTETFAAVKLNVDNWRWRGMPIYLRTGKRMSSKRSEIVIQFKDVAHSILGQRKEIEPARLVIRLQPNEAMRLMLMTKDPGPGGMRLRYVPLNLSYAEAFDTRYPDAYERLLLAVVRDDLGFSMSGDEVDPA